MRCTVACRTRRAFKWVFSERKKYKEWILSQTITVRDTHTHTCLDALAEASREGLKSVSGPISDFRVCRLRKTNMILVPRHNTIILCCDAHSASQFLFLPWRLSIFYAFSRECCVFSHVPLTQVVTLPATSAPCFLNRYADFPCRVSLTHV